VRRLIVDAGPFVALVRASDRHHQAAARFFRNFSGPLVTTVAVIAEVCALLPPRSAVAFLRDIGRGNVTLAHVPESEFPVLAAMMEKYADRPMDFADASLLWLADALGLADIATLDGGFHIYRTRRGRTLRNRFL
jgi:hypothetical protein